MSHKSAKLESTCALELRKRHSAGKQTRGRVVGSVRAGGAHKMTTISRPAAAALTLCFEFWGLSSVN